MKDLMNLNFLSGYRTSIASVVIIVGALYAFFGHPLSGEQTEAVNAAAGNLSDLIEKVGIALGMLGLRGAIKS